MIGKKAAARLLFVALTVSSLAVLAAGYVTSTPSADRLAEGEKIAEPSDGVTVIATDSNSWLGRNGEGPRAEAELLAVGPDGRIRYHDDSHTRYWDVDSVPEAEMTVQYVAADHLSAAECGGQTPCTRNVVERVNLSTGETTRVFERVTPRKHATRWHDADRIDDDHIVVADIDRDRVFIANATSGIVIWSWHAQNAFPTADSGGPYPSDWTHLNDVEVLDDGRIMVSVRNHDQVIFLDRQRGLQRNWTLGTDDRHRTLFEQHNPDYVPESRGGPAVVVADSENNRLVEYQRTDGEWKRTWTWQDARVQWPRDADRLPDGRTLVTDSNGDRVFEVGRDGEVIWQVDVAFPYEAERIGTGPESDGGPSATQAELENRSDRSDDGRDGDVVLGGVSLTDGAIDLIPDGPLTNAVIYVRPIWLGDLEAGALAVLLATSLAWGGVEASWSSWRIRLRRPIEFERGRE